MQQKIRLKNGSEYLVLFCGATETYLEIEIPKSNKVLSEIISEFENPANTNEIWLLDEEGDEIRSPYKDFTNLYKVEFIKGNEQIHTIDRYSIVLKFAATKYATQEDIDIISDAIAELAAMLAE